MEDILLIMAIYHNRVKIISRSNGRSSIAAAAYRAGEKLKNKYDGKTHNYSHRKDILYSEIALPINAPIEYLDRSTLWNSVEKVEKQSNSQLAREVEIALPIELNIDQHIKLVKDYVYENFVNKGMCADFSIHAGHKHTEIDKENPDKVIKKHNPHAHIMLTMRPINVDRSWGEKARKEYILDRNGNKIKQKSGYKSRRIDLTDWDKKETLLKWRKEWANTCNKHLERQGFKARIDHRTLTVQGIKRDAMQYVEQKYKTAQEKIHEHWENIAMSQMEQEQVKIENAEVKKLERLINKLQLDKSYLEELREKIDNEKYIDSKVYLEKSLEQAIKQIENEVEQIDRISIFELERANEPQYREPTQRITRVQEKTLEIIRER